MPFSKDPGKRGSDIYCSLCFQNGELLYKGNDVKEFQGICFEAMVKRGINRYVAKLYVFMIGFAPRWKKNK